MQIVARSLLVLKIMNGSTLALSTVSLVQALSFFALAQIGGGALPIGSIAASGLLYSKHSSALAVVLGILTISETIQFWIILLVTFLDGMVLSFDQPARGALVPALVPREDLMNAISLQSMVHNAASSSIQR